MVFDHLPRLSDPLPPKRRPQRTREEEEARERRRQIAEETLRDVNNGYYFTTDGTKYGFSETQSYGQTNTIWVAPDDQEIQQWRSPTRPITYPFDPPVPATVSIVLSPTVKTIHHLCAKGCRNIGVLNFANPIQPGGGFVSGAEAQEESLARSSNLHTMLTSNEGTEFYVHHMNSETDGFNTHAMIYAPVVIFMRDETGRTVPPSQVAVITCAAVNRVDVRRHFEHSPALVKEMEEQMRERMGRILRLFEECGDKHLILGSFGTGVFQNPTKLVAGIWADLLVGDGARFQKSFETVVFAIKDPETFDEFKQAFAKKVSAAPVAPPAHAYHPSMNGNGDYYDDDETG
ncbi:hypothetical protein DL93DRAFT_2082310 [Clavulina sp. PMI_390]|nr:hypothetical protein DL93DRAFT_2082310 [Clavulina sp. PMI_390]